MRSCSQSCGHVVTFKRHSEEREPYPSKRCESPKYAATPAERGVERGRDTRKKTKVTSATRTSQGDRDDDAPAHSLAGGHSVFDQPPLLNCSCSKSQKRHHTATATLMGDPTPTQSPAQKAVKLKSLIVKPPDGFCLPRCVPYHTMWEIPDFMITYICSLLTRAMVEDEQQCLKFFGRDAASLSWQCMASALYTGVAWHRQHNKVFPKIPSRLESEDGHPRATVFPERPDLPRVSCGPGWKDNLQAWWKYFWPSSSSGAMLALCTLTVGLFRRTVSWCTMSSSTSSTSLWSGRFLWRSMPWRTRCLGCSMAWTTTGLMTRLTCTRPMLNCRWTFTKSGSGSWNATNMRRHMRETSSAALVTLPRSSSWE